MALLRHRNGVPDNLGECIFRFVVVHNCCIDRCPEKENKNIIRLRNMDISLVIPLYNEAESLPELTEWITRVMVANGFSYEILFNK